MRLTMLTPSVGWHQRRWMPSLVAQQHRPRRNYRGPRRIRRFGRPLSVR
jgi:hypothetical protein